MKAQRDAQFLVRCHLKWREERNLEAYHEIIAALDDQNPDIRQVAESLLHRLSPHPQRKKRPPVQGASGPAASQSRGEAEKHAG